VTEEEGEMDMKTDEPNVRLWIDNCRKDIKPVWRGYKAKKNPTGA
jgi:hypothetical protein